MKNGVDLDLKARYRCPALHLAVYGRHLEVVNTLLEAKADPNAAMENGNTAIHVAAKFSETVPLHLLAQGHVDYGLVLTQTLLKHGADPSQADRLGQTGVSIGQRHFKILMSLKEAGAALDIPKIRMIDRYDQ